MGRMYVTKIAKNEHIASHMLVSVTYQEWVLLHAWVGCCGGKVEGLAQNSESGGMDCEIMESGWPACATPIQASSSCSLGLQCGLQLAAPQCDGIGKALRLILGELLGADALRLALVDRVQPILLILCNPTKLHLLRIEHFAKVIQARVAKRNPPHLELMQVSVFPPHDYLKNPLESA